MTDKLNKAIPAFLLEPKYRFLRNLLSALILGVITVSMILNNMDYLGYTIYNIFEWVLYFFIVFGIIFINVFVLVPRYLLKDKLTSYLIRVVLLLFFMLSVLGFFQLMFLSPEGKVNEMEKTEIIFNFLSSLISTGFLIIGSTAILLLRHWIGSSQRINELEASTLQSEIDMLKNQINPHFLLNMLNNANVLIWKNKGEAQRVLYKLEDLLKYQLDDTYKDNVLLSDDIRFLNDFLNLEKIRRDKFEYSILQEGHIDDVRIPSFLFIPFVENAVKHNPDNNYMSYIYIRFHVQKNELRFYCENSKPLHISSQKKAGGLGLKNIKRRLALLYPDRHTLTIHNEEIKYTVELKLLL